MALRKQKDSNLSLLIQAIASAYHRGPDGAPKFQPISFKTGIASATIHLWRHSGVKSARPDYLHALADAYHLDFAAVLGFVYGPKSRVEGDALLAALRAEAQGARRIRPISGGSAENGVPYIGAILDELALIGRWRRWGRRWVAWPLLLQAGLA